MEHDPLEIWDSVLECITKSLQAAEAKVGRLKVVALGITNQRETTIVWDRATGATYATVSLASRVCARHKQTCLNRHACRQTAAQRHSMDGPAHSRPVQAHDGRAGLISECF